MDNAGRERAAKEFQIERKEAVELRALRTEVLVLRKIAVAGTSLIATLDRLGLQTKEYRKLREALLEAALVGGL